ncbi:unnamed protein product [Phytophthora lilii]|uniref:Unnamed protein product n=1 Tax=Phytophthora lilii TaxID=2077276 RepID=A0A9W6TI83_9STRA|nr:unnamed protein product [Phytophthora lilii]
MTHPTSDSIEPIRVGFFDGGSRGNPGPGGSGSVVVEMIGTAQPPEVVWAAATALESRSTTNNVAEFVGLHRLLKRAAAMHWKNLHVVGDSQMIVGLMRRRKAPKSNKMRFWYEKVRRLADQCQVTSWTHHYRAYNKTADWLANQAMDTKASGSYSKGFGAHDFLKRGVQPLIDGHLIMM